MLFDINSIWNQNQPFLLKKTNESVLFLYSLIFYLYVTQRLFLNTKKCIDLPMHFLYLFLQMIIVRTDDNVISIR